MRYEVTAENTKTGKARKVVVEAADKFEAMAKVETMRWAAVGAQRTVVDVLQCRAKAADMLWIGTDPCYRAETNAHITAFYQHIPTTTYTAEHYDYERQAWIGADGRYLCCAHPARMQCTCYGKLHYGELASS